MTRTKTIELSSFDYLDGSESRIVQFAYSTEYGCHEPDTRRFLKTAACDDALAYASRILPQPGKRIILVSALGDFETWGDNKKADAFPYNAIQGEHPADMPTEFFKPLLHKLPKMWGYTIFPTKFDENGNQIGGGNTFHEHLNRFPADLLGKPVPQLQLNKGGPTDKLGLSGFAGRDVIDRTDGRDTRCGYILAAFWNALMRRVELIQEVWEHKLPQVVKALDEGFMPGISMACDIPFDRCSVCGHLAPSEFDYCKHLQRNNRLRGTILRDGTPVVMFNDYPVFFDSSIVKTPAAVEGKTLMKIAGFTPPPKVQDESLLQSMYVSTVVKSASVPDTSRADAINNRFVQHLRLNETPFSKAATDAFSQIPLTELTTYLGVLDIYPTCEDFANIMFGHDPLHKTAGILAEAQLLDILENRKSLAVVHPFLPRVKVASEEVFNLNTFKKVMQYAEPYRWAKSYNADYLNSRTKNATTVDLDKPLSALDDKTKMVLLTKIFMDRDLRARLHTTIINPMVQWELEKLGLDGIYNNKGKSRPVYEELANNYTAVDAGRSRFYQ